MPQRERGDLVLETLSCAAGELPEHQPGTAYDVAGVVVPDVPDAVGLEVGRGEQRLHRGLGPGRLLGRRDELPLRLRLGR